MTLAVSSWPVGTFTGLLVRIWKLSLVFNCALPVCRSLTVLLRPLTLCASDALFLGAALLAESSGITSPDDSGLSFAATRDEGPRSFAPEVVEGLLPVSAVCRALAEVDMVALRPLTDKRYADQYIVVVVVLSLSSAVLWEVG